MLNTFHELVGLTQVRSYLSFGKDEKAIESGLVNLRNNPSIDVRKLIERAMIGGIKRLLGKELDEGDIYGAIALYEKYGDYMPLPSHDPHADDLRMRLAKFAAEKNFRTLALKIVDPYRRAGEVEQRELAAAIQRSFSLEGIQEQEERAYLEVKATWNGNGLSTKVAKKDEENEGNEATNEVAGEKTAEKSADDARFDTKRDQAFLS